MKHITYYIAAMAALLTGAPLHASDEAAATPVPAVQKEVRETPFVTGTPMTDVSTTSTFSRPPGVARVSPSCPALWSIMLK